VGSSIQSLDELIVAFEGHLPDHRIASHLEQLESRARGTVEYHFLLARLYERLAHHNHIGDSPRTIPRLLFIESADHYQRAAEQAPLEHRAYFAGKLSLLSFFLYSFPAADRKKYRDAENLRKASASFSDAIGHSASPRMRTTLSWLSSFSFVLYRRTNEENLLHRELDKAHRLLADTPAKWLDEIERRFAAIEEFGSRLRDEMPSLDPLEPSREQIAYLEGMRAMMKARLHGELQRYLLDTHRDASKRLSDPQRFIALLDKNHVHLATASGRFTTCLEELSFEILRLQLMAQMALTRADLEFERCLQQFRDARRTDRETDHELRLAGQEVLFKAPRDLLDGKSDDEPGPLVEQAFAEAGYPLTDQTGIAVSGGSAILFDGRTRYRIERTDREVLVYSGNHAPTPFDLSGPQQLYDFYRQTLQTAERFYDVDRHTQGYFRRSAAIYSELIESVRALPKSLRGPDLDSLCVTLEGLHRKASARKSSLLELLRSKVTYVWSLLEMFEMRKDTVRLNTLYSGECRLLMRDPHESGVMLEIGADPVFRLAMPLLFRGARGNEEVVRFLRLLLSSAKRTAQEQERCLKGEIQYLEPRVSKSLLFEELFNLYHCHEKLAQGLLAFVEPFVGRLDRDALDRGHESIRLLHEAQSAFDAAARFPSPVVGRGTLAFFIAYVQGVLHGRRAMLFRLHRATAPGERWEVLYDRAEEELR
jgi:hypothetical protein